MKAGFVRTLTAGLVAGCLAGCIAVFTPAVAQAAVAVHADQGATSPQTATTERQDRDAQDDAGRDERERPVTMNGCVARRTAPQDPLTFQDENGFKYRITGRNLGRYQGQRVELIGSSPIPRRFSIRGGLFPSPNVAARAGDLDPGREAIARQPGGTESGTGTAEFLPEFRVTRIRTVEGVCE